METVFWGKERALMVEFMQQGITIMSLMRNIKKLHKATQTKRCGMLTYSAEHPHGNAYPHTAAHTRAFLEHFNWELFDHPPYSPDFTPCD
jgi:hypothetical protein